jgi:hypothetical protein
VGAEITLSLDAGEGGRFRSPNMNAYVERFVQAIQQECLDKRIVFEPEHLDIMSRGGS